MKCEKCGSENVIEGKLTTGFFGMVFTTEKSQKKMPLTKNYSLIKASACKDCGHIFSLRLVTPENIDSNR